MGRKSTATSPRDRKVPRTYRLAPGKVAAAQRVLGAATATEAIETWFSSAAGSSAGLGPCWVSGSRCQIRRLGERTPCARQYDMVGLVEQARPDPPGRIQTDCWPTNRFLTGIGNRP